MTRLLAGQSDTIQKADVTGLSPFNGDHLKHNTDIIILDISENDLFYKKRDQYIGLKGKVGSSRLIRNINGWYKGSIKLGKKKKRFFEEVKISVEVPVTKQSLIPVTDSIIPGSQVRILGIGEDDLYYPNFDKLINQTGTVVTTLVKKEDWWSGEIKLQDGYICRFFKVKVEVTE